MSTEFDPGPGWRRWAPGTVLLPPYIKVVTEGAADVIWVREIPVPPLPTEPYTVIRVERDSYVSQVLMRYDDQWYGINNPDSVEGIAGFEVLAEPRAVTAKAILDRVQQAGAVPWGTLNAIAHEFGVSDV